MRKDPPFDMEYVYATHLFDYAQAQGARVFNSGTAIRNHPEKLAITEFSKYSAPTLVTSDMQRLRRSEEHTSELQSLMRISYAVFCLKKKTQKNTRLRIFYTK